MIVWLREFRVIPVTLIAVGCLSWGISVALGVCLCRQGELHAFAPEGDPYLPEVRAERLAAHSSRRVSSSCSPARNDYGSTRPRRMA